MPERPRVVVTRRAEQAAELAGKLRSAGLEPVLFPTVALRPLASSLLDDVLTGLDLFDWLIFTSGNGVDFFFRRVEALGLNLKLPPTAVVGPATARHLAKFKVSPDFMPQEYTGTALAAGLGNLTGKRVLLPRARLGGLDIVQQLWQQGADVFDVPLYDTVTAAADPAARENLQRGYEAVTFTSPSAVRSFLELVGPPLETAVIACIGPVTAQAAEAAHLPVAIIPTAYTLDELVASLAAFFAET